MTDVTPGGYMTAAEAAAKLGLSTERVRQIFRTGELGDDVIGGMGAGRWYIRREGFTRLVKMTKKKAASKAIDVKGKEEYLLKFIIEYKSEHDGNSPSVREIIAGAGFSSTSMVTYYLDKLERRGRIVREAGLQSRGIKIPGGKWTYQAEAAGNGIKDDGVYEDYGLFAIGSAT